MAQHEVKILAKVNTIRIQEYPKFKWSIDNKIRIEYYEGTNGCPSYVKIIFHNDDYVCIPLNDLHSVLEIFRNYESRR